MTGPDSSAQSVECKTNGNWHTPVVEDITHLFIPEQIAELNRQADEPQIVAAAGFASASSSAEAKVIPLHKHALPFINIGACSRNPPERKWTVPGRVPSRNVTLLVAKAASASRCC